MSPRRRLLAGVAVVVAGMTAGAVGASGAGAAGGALSVPGPVPGVRLVPGDRALSTPPTTDYCLQNLGIHCYQPGQLAAAYDTSALHSSGVDGRGETIAIVDSFGSPTIANDLHVFDQAFGLPDPSLSVISPAGAIPPFDSNNSDMVGWAEETTLDVEWAHVFAPAANILLVETPTSETEGTTGFPEIVQAENYVVNNHLAQIISQSFGATEPTFPSAQSVLDLRSAFTNAQTNNVTVIASSGDDGATDAELNGSDLYPSRAVSWPATDPLVTAVGGTMLDLDDNGNRLAPDVVWNDFASVGGGASGGGLSTIFTRPAFQDGVASTVGAARGTPDISMSAAVDGAVVLYFSFVPGNVGYHLVGGTSEAAPEFAGVVAMADQVAGHALGDINAGLYKIPYGSGLVDVTQGNNTFGPFTNSDGTTHTVVGFDAGTGYDLASGVGTIDAAKFVPELVAVMAPPPVTTASLSPPPVNGYYHNPTVTLSATDQGGSGVASTLYQLDNGTVQTYSVPFQVTGDGSHTLTYWSADTNGVTEQHETLTFSIDTTAPTTTASVSPTPSGGQVNGPATVTLKATDAVSGVANTYYAIDGGATQAGTGPFTITAGGLHTVTYYSVDVAGNTESTKTLTIQVNPQSTATVNGTVPSTLSVSVGNTAPSLGAFTAGVGQTYTGTVGLTVTTSAASSTLTAADSCSPAASCFPGHLVNTSASGGPYALASGLQVDAASANASASGGGNYSDLSSVNPATLLSYSAPVSSDPVAVGFKQPIASTDPLRTGSYTKTVTFTLSTSTP